MSLFTASAQLKVGVIVDPDGYVNVRQGASTSTRIVTTLSSGSKVYYRSSRGNWNEVYTYPGKSFLGFVHGSRVRSYKGSSASSSSSTYWATAKDPDGYVNVRASASTSSAIVGRLTSGYRYQFSGSGTWRKVYKNNGAFWGYVHSSRILR